MENMRGKNKRKIDLVSSLEKTLEIINPKLDSHERIHNIVIVKEDWTVENKLLTPTMKIKRKSIEKIYQEKYNTWYELETVIFI